MKSIDSEPIYQDGLHYDMQTKDFIEDIPFYINQAQNFGDPVLELACGTGRITIPLAEKGYDITGIDISKGMLHWARKKATDKGCNIDFIEADVRNFDLNKKFNLIFIPFNSMLHIHDFKSFEALCSCVRRHLADNGRFIIDIFNPDLARLLRGPIDKPDIEYPDPYGNGTVEIWEITDYDSASQMNRCKWHYKITGTEEAYTHRLNIRIYYPQEIDALLKYNGFIIKNKFGNFDESAFNSNSPKQLIICQVK